MRICLSLRLAVCHRLLLVNVSLFFWGLHGTVLAKVVAYIFEATDFENQIPDFANLLGCVVVGRRDWTTVKEIDVVTFLHV